MAEEIKKEESVEEKTEEVKEKAVVEAQPEPQKEKPKPEPKKEEKKEDEKPVEIPTKFKKLVEEIEKMSVLDLAELVKILEKKFGVSAAAPVVAAVAGVAAPAEEKSFYTVNLTGIGDKKIEVIKVVRDATGKGLKDSKDLVEATASGAQMVKENIKKAEAEELKKKFETAGATVELK